MAFMTVRGAAVVLGVHENTVRHWEQRGLLRAVRLPGSGFRRFNPEDVQALAASMRSPFGPHASLPEVVETGQVARAWRSEVIDE
jgi:excisionase family DNA binding protein